uniref:B-cell receptor CD22 n=1 Tax=Salmo trutta TaxID=8032 RepID=A0A674A4Q7_SALTR
ASFQLLSPFPREDGWSVTYTTQSICTLKGSTVELTCSYTYPSGTVTSTFWFTKMETSVEPEDLGQNPEYAGRLEYHGDKKNGHNLTIRDLRESDSATYKFRFITDQTGGRYYGDPGVTLSVTGTEKINEPSCLQVKVTPAAEGQKTLTCSTNCILTDNPTYIWYRNGQNVQDNSSHMYSISSEDADSYYCAVKGHNGLSSPAVYKAKNTSVSVSPSGEIVEGSSVTLTCSSDANPPVDKYTWYKKNGASLTGSEKTYNFTTISSEDRGEYYCGAENKYGRLNSSSVSVDVQYDPKNTSVSVSPSGEIVEGSSVTLTCSSDANPPVQSYTWWYNKNGGDYQSMTGPQHVFNQIQSSDSGEYYCEAQNEMGTDRSRTINMDVKCE